jgi:hypothetical protein
MYCAASSMTKKNIIKQLEHIVSAIYGFYGKRPNFSRTLIKALFFLQGTHGERLEKQLSTFLAHNGQLFQNGKQRSEISEDLDIEYFVHAFSSFYFHCLHSGLRAEAFNTHAQVKLFSSRTGHFLLEKKERTGGKN